MTSAARGKKTSGRRTARRVPPKRASGAVRLRRNIARHWLLSISILVAGAIYGAAALGFLTKAGVVASALISETAIDAGLTVSEVRIAGIQRTGREDVLAALDVTEGQGLLDIDLDRARQRIEALPWVHSASVTRRLSGAVGVSVKEREPFALWQLNGQVWLIDESGTRITDKGLQAWRSLPLLVGEGAASRGRELLALLAQEPSLAGRVSAAVRVGERRWDVKFRNGVRLMLPEPGGQDGAYGPQSAWRRFAMLQRQHAILEREISVLDMRLPEKLVVRVTEQGQKILRSDGRRTEREEDGKERT